MEIIKNNLTKMLKMFKKCYKIDISEKIDKILTKVNLHKRRRRRN